MMSVCTKLVLLVLLLIASTTKAFVAHLPSSARGVAPVSVSLSTTETTTAATQSSEIAHLQKKLRYWKKEQKTKEDSYNTYVRQQVIDGKLQPIYVRQGKIDTYNLPPVFDQNTDRIKTEVWTIKERIKLTNAKLQEEERVCKLQQETAEELANLQSVREQCTQIRKDSEQQLRDKESEIDTLAQEINGLLGQLQDKRQQLKQKDAVVAELETEVHVKGVTLETLTRERASLRALVRQSWKVLKQRVPKFKKRGGKRRSGGKEEKMKHQKTNTKEKETTPTNNHGGRQSSKVVVAESEEKVLHMVAR